MYSVYEEMPVSFYWLTYCKVIASLIETSDFDFFFLRLKYRDMYRRSIDGLYIVFWRGSLCPHFKNRDDELIYYSHI